LNLSFVESPYVIVLACILSIALISVLVRALLLPLFGISWPRARVRFPWRFSLLALTVLVVLAACTFAILRELPGAAAIGFGLVLVGWLTVVRYVGFKQSLTERRHKEFAATIAERKAQSPENESQ
jgi:hypothetical protein